VEALECCLFIAKGKKICAKCETGKTNYKFASFKNIQEEKEVPKKSNKFYHFLKLNPNQHEIGGGVEIFEILITRAIQKKFFDRGTHQFTELEKQFFLYLRYVFGVGGYGKLKSIFNQIGFNFCSEGTITAISFQGENGLCENLIVEAKNVINGNEASNQVEEKKHICAVQMDSFAVQPGIQMNGSNLETFGAVNARYLKLEG
jgi:hypothetical protein